MKRICEIAFVAVFFAAVALPTLRFFGVEENWRQLAGAEYVPKLKSFTWKGFADRTWQDNFTEHYSKGFFLRRTFFTTAMQLHDWMNFGKFHYGYKGSILDGVNGVLFELPYVRFHLDFDRSTPPAKYDAVIAKLGEIDGFCKSIGADFAFLSFPDKPQLYPEFLPPWLNWFWNYSHYDAQGTVTKMLREKGIKAFDANAFLTELKKREPKWLYPPGGTHLTPVSCGYTAEALVEMLNAGGRSNLKINRFRGAVDTNGIWSVDNDISLLLNTWRNWHVDTNVHYAPVYEHPGKVMNAGSMIVMGDCYRDQVKLIFGDAGCFACDRIVTSRRQGQKPEDFKQVIGDLKLVVLTFQSFNTGRLHEQKYIDELDSIFQAMREARKRFTSTKAQSRR